MIVIMSWWLCDLESTLNFFVWWHPRAPRALCLRPKTVSGRRQVSIFSYFPLDTRFRNTIITSVTVTDRFFDKSLTRMFLSVDFPPSRYISQNSTRRHTAAWRWRSGQRTCRYTCTTKPRKKVGILPNVSAMRWSR